MTGIRRLAILAALVTYGMIVLGAAIRATNSGLSCPDWPTCYGHWLLTPEQFAAQGQTGYAYWQVMLEWGHRAIAAGLLGPVVLILLAMIIWRRRERPALLATALALVALLISQKILGGVTVLDKNSPWSVAAHLCNALLVFAAILKIAADASPHMAARAPRPVLLLGAVACLLALLAMITAAMTAKSGASLACSTWPLCNGEVVPDLDDPLIRIHFLHRTLAGLFGLVTITLAIVAKRSGATPAVRKLAHSAAGLVVFQVALGAWVIIGQVHTHVAVTHQALGVAIFGLVALTTWLALGRPAAGATTTIKGASDGLALRGA